MESELSRRGEGLTRGVGAKERRARREEQLRAQLGKLRAQLQEAEGRADAEEAEAEKWEGKMRWLEQRYALYIYFFWGKY